METEDNANQGKPSLELKQKAKWEGGKNCDIKGGKYLYENSS